MTSGHRTVVRNGTIFTGHSDSAISSDILIIDGTIVAIGDVAICDTDQVIDASGRVVLPGFIDTHAHADGQLFDPAIQQALLRQGITTVIGGQDGVSYAPGDGKYATDYFAAINGPHPTYAGPGVAALLSTYDEQTPVNFGYLVPAGTVRYEVKGYDSGDATDDEIVAMQTLISEGMRDGALGISTGLDYVPGLHQRTKELIAMCTPVVEAGGLHVSHMRGGYESHAQVGTDELTNISLATGIPVHISHYHGPTDLILPLIDGMIENGVDVSFDMYPYRRGCSLLAMVVLPPKVLTGDPSSVVSKIQETSVHNWLLREWFPAMSSNPYVGQDWARNLTLTHIRAKEFDWAHGLTVHEAASIANVTPAAFALQILVASHLEVGAILFVPEQRSYSDLARVASHSRHTVGSDGIYLGKNPHPRGWGSFAKMLRMLVRDHGDYSWSDATRHLSTTAASRFGLSDRGQIGVGFAADIVIINPKQVSEKATYGSPRELASGIDDVLVNGKLVLSSGELTGIYSGRGLRRGSSLHLNQA